ncbi:hypothetical protein H712_02493 [Brucella ovis IntaBari-2009-88-4]|nr:hypothetical protein C010_02514 [Brucella ovis 80/125]ENR06604.1 hypothetical protein C961_02224 [Brucella ovis F8/05B]ENS93236.1 hypothetical protein B999_02490 [Brucella ovis 63/96]ENS97701.1 hypothetical protein C009_02363 [Brucella ovis 81/8]ENT76036.1 hypothetical protein H712_02493 [Brucella ovis IntaBari-2009-88-4]ENT78279.1 hypothetical protein H720_02284 [Brucella ovis IntaBari-2006-46-348]ENT81828.1 hypothetical protein H713_02496 [Brucella ovis IntaBari-2010-47-268]ENT86912.1 h
MVTLFDRKNAGGQPAGDNPAGHHGHQHQSGYTTYQEPDTRVPPKPRPVFDAVSVNGVTIDEADILTEAQNHPAENPGAALLSAARALAVRELLLQRAREIGIEPEHEKDAETDEDALVRMVIEREVDVPSASRDEAQRYYENNRHRFTSAPILEASHILIAADPADQETRDAARQTATRLAAAVIAEPANLCLRRAGIFVLPVGRTGRQSGPAHTRQHRAGIRAGAGADDTRRNHCQPHRKPFRLPHRPAGPARGRRGTSLRLCGRQDRGLA